MTVRWSHGDWRVEMRLPFGVSGLVGVGKSVHAGEVVANGTHYRATRRVDAAKVLGCAPGEVRGLLRVPIGGPVRAGAILARRGKRLPRAIVAGEDGRVVHVDMEGGLHIATVRSEWSVRSVFDGVVRRADTLGVTVEGAAWALTGLAAFGPRRAGVLASGVRAPEEELAASRLDVTLAGRVIIGGARVSGEALARAHAVGAAGVVAGSASFRALLPVYGEDTSAGGASSDEDVPTLLVLGAFGHAPFDAALYDALARLEGSRAAIDTASARLFVFAPPDASRPLEAAELRLEKNLSGAGPS